MPLGVDGDHIAPERSGSPSASLVGFKCPLRLPSGHSNMRIRMVGVSRQQPTPALNALRQGAKHAACFLGRDGKDSARLGKLTRSGTLSQRCRAWAARCCLG